MIKSFFLFAIVSFALSFNANAQDMNPEKLKQIITKVADTIVTNSNSIQLLYNKTMLVCIYDENANRMRIISPIVEQQKLNEEQILNALVANFHSALDVKYALSEEILWSIFTHPLRELTNKQLEDAIKQVYRANINFGSTYSSTNLIFPGTLKKNKEPTLKKLIEKKIIKN